jgi:hypothetical protein
VTTESTARIATQRPAFQLLADLAEQHPDLPPAHIMIERTWQNQPSAITVTVEAPTHFTPWLTALGIKPAGVTLCPSGRGSWIEASTVHEGHRIEIAAHGILVTQDQVRAPRTVEAVSA